MFIKKINLSSGIIHTEEQTTEHQNNSIFLVSYNVPKCRRRFGIYLTELQF